MESYSHTWASLEISMVPGSEETLSNCMLNYAMSMQIMLVKTGIPNCVKRLLLRQWIRLAMKMMLCGKTCVWNKDCHLWLSVLALRSDYIMNSCESPQVKTWRKNYWEKRKRWVRKEVGKHKGWGKNKWVKAVRNRKTLPLITQDLFKKD